MNSPSAAPKEITSKELIQYGFLALPVAFAGYPLYVLAPDFFATHHGLSLSLLGTLFLAIRLFDAIQDPLVGWLADKFHSYFLPFVIIAAGLLCSSIFGLFNFVMFNPAIWLAICMGLAVSAYSVLTIILGTYATLWTTSKYDQTRIASTRESFGLIGLLIAVSIPTILLSIIDSNNAYIWYTIILASLMAFGIIGFSKLPKIDSSYRQNSPLLLSGLRALPRETLHLLLVYSLTMLASSIPAVLVIFFIRDLLGAEHLVGLFLLLYFLSGVAGMPLWKYVSAKVGKCSAWCLSNILAVIGFAGAFSLDVGDVWAYAAICIISGLALGGDLTLPPSILADQVNRHNNTAYSGIHYALLAFIAKASLAIATAIALPTLDAAGFKPKIVNSEQALFILSASYAVIPCVIKIAAIVLLYWLFIRPNPGGNYEIVQNYTNNGSSRHV